MFRLCILLALVLIPNVSFAFDDGPFEDLQARNERIIAARDRVDAEMACLYEFSIQVAVCEGRAKIVGDEVIFLPEPVAQSCFCDVIVNSFIPCNYTMIQSCIGPANEDGGVIIEPPGE